MTKIIAYGKNGKNLIFELKQEAMKYFNLTWHEMDTRIKSGKPIEDPKTKEKYYIDELIDIDTQLEEKPCKEKCDDWEDWD